MKDQSLSEAFKESFFKVLNDPKYFTNISKAYSESPKWTKVMLGRVVKGQLNRDSLLRDVLEGIDVHKASPNARLKVFYEYYHIDIMLTEENWHKVVDENTLGYYWKPIICVEHENRNDSWYSELIKLSNISSRLNVVIGYCSREYRGKAIERASELINLQLESMNKKPFDEYLVILGLRNNDLEKEKTKKQIIEGFDFFSLQEISSKYQFREMQ